MSAAEIARTLIASYLIATLSATALAKLRNRRGTSIGIQREMVIPARFAAAATLTLIAAEFSLATLLMLGTEPAETGSAAGTLFLVFAGYRILVAAKTKSLTCSCAGTMQTDPASVPSVAGASLACLALAALAYVLTFLGPPPGYPVNLLPLAAWITPITIILAANARQGFRKPDRGDLYPAKLQPLWTADIQRKALTRTGA
jgi:hypothetical protein